SASILRLRFYYMCTYSAERKNGGNSTASAADASCTLVISATCTFQVKQIKLLPVNSTGIFSTPSGKFRFVIRQGTLRFFLQIDFCHPRKHRSFFISEFTELFRYCIEGIVIFFYL